MPGHSRVKHLLTLVVFCWVQAALAQPKPCASGMDVSHFQGQVDWPQARAAGIEFSYVKATGGVSYVDPRFQANWQAMRQTGVLRGAYHFYYAKDDPIQQAEHFLNTIGPLSDNDLPPVIDIEISDQESDTDIIDGVLAWIARVRQAGPHKPVIYTGLSFANKYLDDPRLADYSLWVAEYRSEPQPVLPKAWRNRFWLLWQHSENGQVAGVPGKVDLNAFNGHPDDRRDLMAGRVAADLGNSGCRVQGP